MKVQHNELQCTGLYWKRVHYILSLLYVSAVQYVLQMWALYWMFCNTVEILILTQRSDLLSSFDF